MVVVKDEQSVVFEVFTLLFRHCTLHVLAR